MLCFIYTTFFKKVKLRLPFTRFERELLTELNIAPAQLHPNSWAFVRAFQIICAHLGLPASVDVFLFLFEAKNPGDRLWVSLNGIAGRSILSIFQQSYKDWKGKFVKVCQNDQDPSLLDGFPLYWVNKGNKDSKESFRRPHHLNNFLRVRRGPARSSHRSALYSTPSPSLQVNTNLASSPLYFGILLFCVDLDLSSMYYLCHFYMDALACFASALVADLFFTLCR